MSWKLKSLITWILAVPALTGFPMNHIPGNVLPGAGYGWLTYGAIVHAAIILLLGKKVYKLSIMVALTIAIPVVLLGTLISYVALFIGGGHQAPSPDFLPHYIKLLLTMVVVIPLALSMVAVIPFHKLEHHILLSKRGVTIWEKIALMFLRVFSHIFYFVLPNILEVIREEGVLTRKSDLPRGRQNNTLSFSQRIGKITQILVTVGVESICSAIRYVPLWAEEISRLPGHKKTNKNPDTPEHAEK